MLHNSLTDSGVEEEPEQQGVLNVFGLVHDLVEVAEVRGRQNARQFPSLLGRS